MASKNLADRFVGMHGPSRLLVEEDAEVYFTYQENEVTQVDYIYLLSDSKYEFIFDIRNVAAMLCVPATVFIARHADILREAAADSESIGQWLHDAGVEE